MSFKYFFLLVLVSIQALQGEDNLTEVSTWEVPEEFIWDLGLAAKCDIGMFKDPNVYGKNWWVYQLNPKDFENVKTGDIAWMRPNALPQFTKDILPGLKHPIVILVNNSDYSFPSDIAGSCDINALLDNPKIIHIFASNCDYKGTSKKVSHVPIGMDFHSLAYIKDGKYGVKSALPNEQAAILKKILNTLPPTTQRKMKAYVDFQLNDSMRTGESKRYLLTGEDRTMIFDQLKLTNLIDYGGKLSREELWKKKGEYTFSISPHGNGLDCLRTWEDLLLGCIVIVKKSALDPLYEGLPVVIIDNWSEVTADNFDKWLKQYGDVFHNPDYREKLTHRYWMNKIRKASSDYKKIHTEN